MPFDIIIIPNMQNTVKKSWFLTRIVSFGIHVDKAPDFVYCGAALLLKMRGHNIGCLSNGPLYLFGGLLSFGICHVIASFK